MPNLLLINKVIKKTPASGNFMRYGRYGGQCFPKSVMQIRLCFQQRRLVQFCYSQ